MTKNNLFTSLNKLCNNLDNVYNINSGGCCYVAACLAEQLELHNIPFKVIYYNLWSCHYAIKVSDRYLNRCDYRKKEITEIYNISSKELFDIYNKNNWNKSYNIDNNKIVKLYIVTMFKNYENSRTRFRSRTIRQGK